MAPVHPAIELARHAARAELVDPAIDLEVPRRRLVSRRISGVLGVNEFQRAPFCSEPWTSSLTPSHSFIPQTLCILDQLLHLPRLAIGRFSLRQSLDLSIGLLAVVPMIRF